MTRPTDPGFRDRLVRAIRSGRVRGVGPGAGAVELIGHGESYAAWRTDQVVVRVATRHPSEMPKPIADEFAALRRVPQELGSRGVAYDDEPDNALGCAYVVTTYVAGRPLGVDEWNPERIRRHAEQLGRLHLSHPAAGPGTPVSVEAHAGLDWWRQARPDVVDRLEPLAEPWLTYLKARDDAWAGSTMVGLIHGDLVTTNIVMGPDDEPRYVDWEWGGPGDAAKDLAMLGGTVHGGPWYVPLDDAAVAGLLDAYAAARTRLGSPVDPVRLAIQRDAWEVAERFLGLLYFLTRASEEPYRRATEEIRRTLTTRLEQ